MLRYTLSMLCARDDAVAMGWQLLGNVGDPSRQILSPAMPLQAQSLIFACDTPLVHPYLMLRFAESLKAAAGLDPKGRPLQDRKVVVLATRMNDKNTFNGGRRYVVGSRMIRFRHAPHT